MGEKDAAQKIDECLERATRRQFEGDTPAAIKILEKGEELARTLQDSGLVYILIQKAGWLRELGRLEEAGRALREAELGCEQMSSSAAPLPSLRMEQGIVARRAGDL